MLYSRWSDSQLYTFWEDAKTNVTANDQVFVCMVSIDEIYEVTYRELVDRGLESVALEFLAYSYGSMNVELRQELVKYMKQFKLDVEKEFNVDKPKHLAWYEALAIFLIGSAMLCVLVGVILIACAMVKQSSEVSRGEEKSELYLMKKKGNDDVSPN
jgi:hypothetical protein